MRIILSRKGFDGKAGGCASPILPKDRKFSKGAMPSIPIPDSRSPITYDDLEINGTSYADIMAHINARKTMNLHGKGCHVDPDINEEAWKELPKNWAPAFGQIGSAQTMLQKAEVGPGDLFLFFGWFRQTCKRDDGSLKYSAPEDNGQNIQAIYGYLEIKEVLENPEEIKERFPWHPHSLFHRLGKTSNALYLPTDKLSFNPKLPGYGTMAYDEKRVLTLKGFSRSNWKKHGFLEPDNLIMPKKKNLAKYNNAIRYGGQWQELIFNCTDEMFEWVKEIIE